jgi:hypothetical protein
MQAAEPDSRVGLTNGMHDLTGQHHGHRHHEPKGRGAATSSSGHQGRPGGSLQAPRGGGGPNVLTVLQAPVVVLIQKVAVHLEASSSQCSMQLGIQATQTQTSAVLRGPPITNKQVQEGQQSDLFNTYQRPPLRWRQYRPCPSADSGLGCHLWKSGFPRCSICNQGHGMQSLLTQSSRHGCFTAVHCAERPHYPTLQ